MGLGVAELIIFLLIGGGGVLIVSRFMRSQSSDDSSGPLPDAALGVTLSCPSCGEQTEAARPACQHCGEDL